MSASCGDKAMTAQTPAPDDEWLDEIVERMAYCIGESKAERRDDTSQIFDEMKAAILQEIQNHDRQLLERIEGLLPEKFHIEHGFYGPSEQQDLAPKIAFNQAIDQVKTILNDEKERL